MSHRVRLALSSLGFDVSLDGLPVDKVKKPILFATLVLFLANLMIAGWLSAALATEVTESECIRCHTNVKGLIRLSWDVEKVKPAKPKSAETSGEG
jgi:hypothetical protein